MKKYIIVIILFSILFGTGLFFYNKSQKGLAPESLSSSPVTSELSKNEDVKPEIQNAEKETQVRAQEPRVTSEEEKNVVVPVDKEGTPLDLKNDQVVPTGEENEDSISSQQNDDHELTVEYQKKDK